MLTAPASQAAFYVDWALLTGLLLAVVALLGLVFERAAVHLREATPDEAQAAVDAARRLTPLVIPTRTWLRSAVHTPQGACGSCGRRNVPLRVCGYLAKHIDTRPGEPIVCPGSRQPALTITQVAALDAGETA